MSQPTIALVGRPNVGKSALFNCLVGRKIAIVHDQPGVTRDRLCAPYTRGAYEALIVDTGGIGAAADENFAAAVEREADIAMESADIVLFVCDCRESLTQADRSIAVRLHRSRTPVLLVLNKADTEKQELSFGEFAELGFEGCLFTSAAHGRGLDTLSERLDEMLKTLGASARSEKHDQEEQESIAPRTEVRLAVVGRPNAGKSSLINAILQDRRTIVSEVAGTTRDAVDIPYRRGNQDYVLIDTAGMRPRSRRDSSVEVFSAMRSERAIRRADVCLLVVDAAAGITHQDRRIASTIAEEKKPCIVVMNKYDLFCPGAPDKARRAELGTLVREQLFFLDNVPFVVACAREARGVSPIFSAIERLRKSSSDFPGTGELNRLLQRAMLINPPPSGRSAGSTLKLYYATVALNEKYSVIPVPTYVLFVNDKRLLSDSYAQYLRNTIHSRAGAAGIPTVLSVRSRVRRT